LTCGPADMNNSVTAGNQALPTILVVDDAPLSVDLLLRILRSEGFRAIGAEDRDSVFQQCASERVDLILLDVLLNGQSGLEICSELKGNPATSDIPVIFLSALDDPHSRVAGFKAGGVDYVCKPFYTREILARVRVHLRLRQLAERLIRQQKSRLEELREAQQSILVTPEDVPQGCFAVYYRPLETVGGDIYDVVPLGSDLVGYFVADISGHGVKASFLTSAIKALLRQYSSPVFAIEDTMRNMNAVMRTTLNHGNYASACYARLSKSRRKLAVVSAGHPPLILVSSGHGDLVNLESEPLGVFGNVAFQKQELTLKDGDRFYLYTDGLIEDAAQPGRGRTVGLERLRSACERYHHESLDEGVASIVADLKPDESALDDDLLLMGVEVRS
jgi:phosphoserine phosphatase RsbU/P